MAAVKAGDRVRVVARDITSEDEKTGLYYSYFGGLTGTIDRVYDDGSVCLDIDLDSLSQEARDRHLAMQETERRRWLESLSGEMRSRLTPEQRQLTISYKLLVSGKDVVPDKSPKPSRKSETEEASGEDSSAAPRKGPARAPEPEAVAVLSPRETEETEEQVGEAEQAPEAASPKRLSESDLDAKEEEYLRSLRRRS